MFSGSVCLSYGSVYIALSKNVQGTGLTGGGELLRERERERERGIQAAGLCLSVQNRGPTVLDLSHMHSHTHAHTLTDERTVYSDQQRVCSEAGSRKLTD